ncbi:MAG TPA: NAD(P)H-quinone oxidoreductase [Sphingobium sp.]|nr:NAD(P)H-quinone oxidoreductase [Sphingobium sp.]
MHLPNVMAAIEIAQPGGPESLRLTTRHTPTPSADEVLIRVASAGLNHGDLMQRRGFYSPPQGTTDIPGLEVAGTVAAVGPDVQEWSEGDRVCALLAGGGYAEYAAAPAGQCLPVPESMDIHSAAALPEALFTCWTTLIDDGKLAPGEDLLVHGGASGIGTMAIQMAKLLGSNVFATAGTPEKCEVCQRLGADLAINYKHQDFVAAIQEHTGGRGVDVVLDMVGGDYVARDMEAMAPKGRHVTIGLLSGVAEATVPMPQLIAKQLVLTASTLRGRTVGEKRAIRDRLLEKLWPAVKEGRILPVIHACMPLAEAAEAHRLMEEGKHIGKILLTV